MKKVIKTEDKTPEIIMAVTGVDEATARFILALERGEIEGDIIDESDEESSE